MKIYKVTYYATYYGETCIYSKKYFTNEEEASDYIEYLELRDEHSEKRVSLDEIETSEFADILPSIIRGIEELRGKKKGIRDQQKRIEAEHPSFKKFHNKEYRPAFFKKLMELREKYSPANFEI